MKQRIIVGLLIILFLAPVVEVFSASKDSGPFLTPEQQEGLGVQQPSTIAEFPFAPNRSDLGLTFVLWITNRIGDVPITITTHPSGLTPTTRTFNFSPGLIAPVDPVTANCPPEQVCRLVVSAPGTTGPFDAVLQISTMTGAPVGFLPTSFYFTTQ
jgi:hypothetical protein